MNHAVIPYDILSQAVSEMKVKNPFGTGYLDINFDMGNHWQIIKNLAEFNNTITKRGLKYPLIAIQYPQKERRGGDFYATLTIPRILIATLTKSDTGSEYVKDKYSANGVFKTILYPCYYEFLRQLSFSKSTNFSDPDSIVHTKTDSPSEQQIAEGLEDYVDIIEINNLEITLIQIKTC